MARKYDKSFATMMQQEWYQDFVTSANMSVSFCLDRARESVEKAAKHGDKQKRPRHDRPCLLEVAFIYEILGFLKMEFNEHIIRWLFKHYGTSLPELLRIKGAEHYIEHLTKKLRSESTPNKSRRDKSSSLIGKRSYPAVAAESNLGAESDGSDDSLVQPVSPEREAEAIEPAGSESDL
jgi:hypothetical protein